MSRGKFVAGVAVRHALSLMSIRERDYWRGKPPGACVPVRIRHVIVEQHRIGADGILVSARYEPFRPHGRSA